MVTNTASKIILGLHPAQLLIGANSYVTAQIEYALQRSLCSAGGCTYCNICLALHKHSYHRILWLQPVPTYSRESIQPILETVTLQQANNTPFYII
jgi:hypothetical protein